MGGKASKGAKKFGDGLVSGLTLGECDGGGCFSGHTHDLIDTVASGGKKYNHNKDKDKDKEGIDKIADTLGVDKDTLKNIALLFGGMFLLLMLINLL